MKCMFRDDGYYVACVEGSRQECASCSQEIHSTVVGGQSLEINVRYQKGSSKLPHKWSEGALPAMIEGIGQAMALNLDDWSIDD